jgi:hypothetical protein
MKDMKEKKNIADRLKGFVTDQKSVLLAELWPFHS